MTDGLISVANMTSTTSGANTTLDFDISTSNVTLDRWKVEVQQNNSTIKTFGPTGDPRGPGASSGSNPLHVRLPWNGISDNNQAVTGNITWVVTANTTSYVSGGPVNDGVASAQARLDARIESKFFEIKKISASSVTMLDVHNQPITLPQYDSDLRKKEPIALPIHDAFPLIRVQIQATLPPDGEPHAYYVWGEAPDGTKIFGPGQLTPVPGLNQVDMVVLVDKITMYPQIKWYYIPKEGGEIGFIGTTDSPVYVILDSPQEPQLKPRVDVVDFAVATQKGNNDTRNELRITSFLATRIHTSSGFLYDRDTDPHHTTQRDNTGLRLDFTVSNFLDYPGNVNLDNKGNCQDFSNLFQVCSAALGLQPITVRRIDGPFHFRRVLPVGFSDWFENPKGYVLDYHQVGWSTSQTTVFDPTYRLDDPRQADPRLPINMRLDEYQALLQDPHRDDEWTELAPVRPLTVK